MTITEIKQQVLQNLLNLYDPTRSNPDAFSEMVEEFADEYFDQAPNGADSVKGMTFYIGYGYESECDWWRGVDFADNDNATMSHSSDYSDQQYTDPAPSKQLTEMTIL